MAHRSARCRRIRCAVATIAGAALTLLVAGACDRARHADTYLVALEAPFWRAVTEAYPELESDLSAAVLGGGRHLGITHLGPEQPLEALHAQLADDRPAGVILTPLLSLQADEVAAAYPDLRVVVLTWTGEAAATDAARPAGPNVTTVSFARKEALTRAGRLLAAYIAEQPEGMVGILATGGRVERAHVTAFRAGLTSGGAGGRVTERRIDQSADSGALKRSLAVMQRSEVRVVYLEVGALTGEALDVLASEGMFAIVRNWGYRAGFEETVLLSVDDPPLAAILTGIEAAAGSNVEVASEVVWGTGAPLPTGTDSLFDAVRSAP